MAVAAHLPANLWPEAVGTTVYLVNVTPAKLNKEMPPLQRYMGKTIKISPLKVLVFTLYSHIRKEERTKMDPRADLCMMAGYDLASKAYRLYHLVKHKIFVTKDAGFDESKIAITKHKNMQALPTKQITIPLELNNERDERTTLEQDNLHQN